MGGGSGCDWGHFSFWLTEQAHRATQRVNSETSEDLGKTTVAVQNETAVINFVFGLFKEMQVYRLCLFDHLLATADQRCGK